MVSSTGLFPYGKSGLKFGQSAQKSGVKWSLPVWEEWIEILRLDEKLCVWVRLFPYGKSGLKSNHLSHMIQAHRLFPYGKSGLKYICYKI